MEEYSSSQGISSSDLKHSSNLDDFRSSIHNLELQLAKSKEEKAHLHNKLDEANERFDQSQKRIAAKEEELHDKQRKIKELESKIEQKPKIVPAGSVDLLSFHHQLKTKDEEIAELKNILRQKDEIIASLKVHTQLEDQKFRAACQSASKNLKKYELADGQLEQTKKKLDNSHLTKRNEGTLLVEIEHYKADNARLVTLLKSTDEFSNFADFAEASEGVRYLPRTGASKIDAEKETDDWVPSQAFTMVKDFLAKYGEKGFKSIQINQLLEDLNAIWRRREKNLISQVRSKCNRELEKLRRQLSHAPCYDQVVSSDKIDRLKSDLKRANSDLRNVASCSVRAVARPHGFIY